MMLGIRTLGAVMLTCFLLQACAVPSQTPQSDPAVVPNGKDAQDLKADENKSGKSDAQESVMRMFVFTDDDAPGDAAKDGYEVSFPLYDPEIASNP